MGWRDGSGCKSQPLPLVPACPRGGEAAVCAMPWQPRLQVLGAGGSGANSRCTEWTLLAAVHVAREHSWVPRAQPAALAVARGTSARWQSPWAWPPAWEASRGGAKAGTHGRLCSPLQCSGATRPDTQGAALLHGSGRFRAPLDPPTHTGKRTTMWRGGGRSPGLSSLGVPTCLHPQQRG